MRHGEDEMKPFGMKKQIQDAYDLIESLGEYIGEMEKRARWGQPLKGSAVAFALELIAVRDTARAAMGSLTTLQADVAAMLETLNRKENAKGQLIHDKEER